MKVYKSVVFSFILFSFTTACTYAEEAVIEVTGTAKESVVPDIARFSFSINGRGKELAHLKSEIDKKTADTVSLCKNLGVSIKNITSSEVAIHPQYNYQNKSFIGYQVSRNVKVVLEDLDNYSALINGAIKSGITTLNNVTLDTKNHDVLEHKALAAAITAAKRKAEILAVSSNVSLGKVLYVKEIGSPMRQEAFRFKQRALSDASSQNAFEPGEISVTATVSVKYSIK